MEVCQCKKIRLKSQHIQSVQSELSQKVHLLKAKPFLMHGCMSQFTGTIFKNEFNTRLYDNMRDRK